MGNAHANRPTVGHVAESCIFCKKRPKFGSYKNSTGNRHNPASKRRGKRAKK